DPNWPKYASLSAVGSAGNPFSILSRWSGGADVGGVGGHVLNYKLPSCTSCSFGPVISRAYAYGRGRTPAGANFAFSHGWVPFIRHAIKDAPLVWSVALSGAPQMVTLLAALASRSGEEVVDAAQY